MAATAEHLESISLRAARIDLAAMHRIAGRLSFDDGIWNHFTLMLPGAGERFLVKAHGLLMSQVTAGNLIVVDAEGNVVEDEGQDVVGDEGQVERSAFSIHYPIHKLHPRAQCVLHAHPTYSTWLADLEGGRLQMVNQDSLRFYDRVAYDDNYQGGEIELSGGAGMAHALGDKSILVSANHGVTVVGTTVAEAFYDLYYLEKACKRQHMVAASGQTPRVVSDDVAVRSCDHLNEELSVSAALHFDALKRVLDADEPEYAD